jgi:hypothetical protein
LGIDVAAVGGATCLSSLRLQPAAVFRRACGLGVQSPVSEAQLDEVVRYMDRLGETFAVTAAPHAQPPALPAWLEARGFKRGYAFMKFSRPTRPPIDAPTDLDVAVIGPEHGPAFGRVVSTCFGLPPLVADWLAHLPGREHWVCLLASAEGGPAAAAAVYIQGTHAWLGLGATLPAFRQRGGQSALIARRVREAALRGASIAVTETGERVPDRPSNSYRNILRCGFTEQYLRQNYLSPARS